MRLGKARPQFLQVVGCAVPETNLVSDLVVQAETPSSKGPPRSPAAALRVSDGMDHAGPACERVVSV